MCPYFPFTRINFQGILHHDCGVVYDENRFGPIRTRKCRGKNWLINYMLWCFQGDRKGTLGRIRLNILKNSWNLFCKQMLGKKRKLTDRISWKVCMKEINFRPLQFQTLLNKRQRTKINNSYSTWMEIVFGVPQGSILGPLLF